MRPDKTIKIAPYRFRIREDDQLSSVAGASGALTEEAQIILLDPAMGPDAERDTILHEVMHGLLYVTFGGKRPIDRDMEEQVVSGMSPAMLRFLRDNEAWIDWLREVEHVEG